MSTRISPMPLPAKRKRNWYSTGTIALEPLGRLDEDGAEDRAGHRPEAADHDHGEHADALDGSEDRLAERLLVEREQAAGERREEAREREARAAWCAPG